MNINKLFLVILAVGGIVFTACKKEEKTNENFKPSIHSSILNTKSLVIMQMWCYAMQDCAPIEDHCFPPIVIKPNNGNYIKLKEAIASGTEDKFFNYTAEAKQLFPFLYNGDENGQKFLPCLLDKGNKLIVMYNKELQKEFYLCVNDELDPKNYKEGMEKLTLQLTIN